MYRHVEPTVEDIKKHSNTQLVIEEDVLKASRQYTTSTLDKQKISGKCQ